MKAAPFRYTRAESPGEAVSALVQLDAAKVLAGGQSLLAMMNFPLAQPDVLIDIGRRGGRGRSRPPPGGAMLNQPHAIAPPVQPRHIGARIPRSDDAGPLTGRGQYLADLRLRGELHLAFVRSTMGHARLHPAGRWIRRSGERRLTP